MAGHVAGRCPLRGSGICRGGSRGGQVCSAHADRCPHGHTIALAARPFIRRRSARRSPFSSMNEKAPFVRGNHPCAGWMHPQVPQRLTSSRGMTSPHKQLAVQPDLLTGQQVQRRGDRRVGLEGERAPVRDDLDLGDDALHLPIGVGVQRIEHFLRYPHPRSVLKTVAM